jgi:hypothetical protein
MAPDGRSGTNKRFTDDLRENHSVWEDCAELERPSPTNPADVSSRQAFARIAVLAALLTFSVLALGAGPAAAAKPCWKRLINDWYDGRIDHAYPVKCYRDAIKNLPEDVQAYSSARDDINRALLAAIRRNGGGPVDENQIIQPQPSEGGGTTTSGSGTGKPKPAEPVDPTREPETPTTTGTSREADEGPFDDFLRTIGPNNVDSLPLPILVLGGIAVLLFGAAAASWAARRIQARRVPIATTPPTRPPDRR